MSESTTVTTAPESTQSSPWSEVATPTPRVPGTPLRILVTGSRHWRDLSVIRRALARATDGYDPGDVTVIHGGQSSWDRESGVRYGADHLADIAAVAAGHTTEVHLAEWDKHGKAAGPIRNQAMVDAGADVCLAFPMDGSRGTVDCMRRAMTAGIPTRVTFGMIAHG